MANLRKYISTLFILVLFFLIFENSSFSAQPILLKNADSLVGIVSGKLQVRNFIGNVVFEQGNIILKCDTAIQYVEENRVDMNGNVVVTQNLMIIKSPSIKYNGNTKKAFAEKSVEIIDTANTLKATSGIYNFDSKIAEFSNNVSVENDSLLIYSDSLINNTGTNESFANGNVKVFGKKIRTALVADTLIHKPQDKFIYAYGNAGFFMIDTVSKEKKENLDYEIPEELKKPQTKLKFDTLSIFSKTIFGNQIKDQELYQFFDSVKINRGNIASKCSRADFFKSGDSLVLTGNPIVWYDSLQLFADTINVLFPNQKLKKIKLINNSFTVSKSDTIGIGRIDQISGKNIDINFKDDTIDVLISMNQAKSLYFMTDDKGETGAQNSGADTITIFFEANSVKSIKWRSAGFIDFYPEKIFPLDIKTLYLPHFRMRTDKPEKRTFPSITREIVKSEEKNKPIQKSKSKTKKKN